uniref:Uncharacterized protein n=1 Tax=Lepeophtheirus salmonis TaxID=72036 RepID=A0A0K2TSZ9_LEPSM
MRVCAMKLIPQISPDHFILFSRTKIPKVPGFLDDEVPFNYSRVCSLLFQYGDCVCESIDK